MRRKDRERDRAFAYEVIDRCEYGVAALGGAEDSAWGMSCTSTAPWRGPSWTAYGRIPGCASPL